MINDIKSTIIYDAKKIIILLSHLHLKIFKLLCPEINDDVHEEADHSHFCVHVCARYKEHRGNSITAYILGVS